MNWNPTIRSVHAIRSSESTQRKVSFFHLVLLRQSCFALATNIRFSNRDFARHDFNRQTPVARGHDETLPSDDGMIYSWLTHEMIRHKMIRSLIPSSDS